MVRNASGKKVFGKAATAVEREKKKVTRARAKKQNTQSFTVTKADKSKVQRTTVKTKGGTSVTDIPQSSLGPRKSLVEQEQTDTSQFGPRKSILDEAGGIPVLGGQEPVVKEELGFFDKTTPLGITRKEQIGLLASFTGVGALGRVSAVGAKIVSKAVVGKAARTGVSTTVAKFATNTKSIRLSKKLLIEAGLGIVGATLVVDKLAGTYPFATFEIAEAMDKLSIAKARADKAGRQDLVDELDAFELEMLNPVAWQNVMSKIPILNIQRAATKNIEAAVLSSSIFNKIIEDRRIQAENSTSEEDYWRQRDAEIVERERQITEDYNNERQIQLRWEQEARTAERDDNARFWAAQQAKSRENEAADRKAIADFWFEYRKKSQEIADNNRPSNLNFGLL